MFFMTPSAAQVQCGCWGWWRVGRCVCVFATVPWRASRWRYVEPGVENPPANAGDARDAGPACQCRRRKRCWTPGPKQKPSCPIGLNHFDSGSGRSPGGGNGSPLQYSRLGNPMGRGARRATVHAVTESGTRLKRLNRHPGEQPGEMDGDSGHILWPRSVPNTRIFKMEKAGTSLVAQWLMLCTPKAGTWDSIPGQGTRSHVPPTAKDPTC